MGDVKLRCQIVSVICCISLFRLKVQILPVNPDVGSNTHKKSKRFCEPLPVDPEAASPWPKKQHAALKFAERLPQITGSQLQNKQDKQKVDDSDEYIDEVPLSSESLSGIENSFEDKGSSKGSSGAVTTSKHETMPKITKRGRPKKEEVSDESRGELSFQGGQSGG